MWSVFAAGILAPSRSMCVPIATNCAMEQSSHRARLEYVESSDALTYRTSSTFASTPSAFLVSLDLWIKVRRWRVHY